LIDCFDCEIGNDVKFESLFIVIYVNSLLINSV